MKRLGWLMFGWCLLLAACSGGAVVFAPAQPTPDVSPLIYTHASGAFSLAVPRNWAVYDQNTTTLASASFAPAGEHDPAITIAVIHPSGAGDSQNFAALIDQYQTQVRPDLERYKENDRQAMGDGSWRATGLRLTPLGATQQVNTFIQRAGPLFAVIDIVVPESQSALVYLQSILNTFSLNPEAALEPAPLTTLNMASGTSLSVLHVAHWTTPDGVFFVTGEVANFGTETATDIPVIVRLETADGLVVAEASDTVMGHGIPPGGFAPFSLRFGQGQPALSAAYEIRLGEGWTPDPAARVIGPEALSWTDESSVQDGRLVISGTITNESGAVIRDPLAVVTVFDVRQNVIAAGFAPADATQLAPGESARYSLIIHEMGSEPANYSVIAQALPG